MRVGSLCTGYGGLDIAVESVLGAETVWLSEIDKNAAKVCEARFPGVPNLGDLTEIDWASAAPIDVLTAGYPCQPFSHAGKRQGTDDDRHIWPEILESLRVLRPRLAVFENVAGHLSLGFDTVLADLAGIGFDAEWCVVRASDLGACHQRRRLFILATDTHQQGLEGPEPAGRYDMRAGSHRVLAADPGRERHGGGQDGGVVGRVDGQDAGGPRERQWSRTEPGHRGDAAVAHPRGERCNRRPSERGARGDAPEWGEAFDPPGDGGVAWGDYEGAIDRHAVLTGRCAPGPVDDAGRLSARFVEWMMCLPEGWVTDVLPRRPALKALGNGVVPPQAAFAIDGLLRRRLSTVAASVEAGK